jgi:nicotinamidase-related amidase
MRTNRGLNPLRQSSHRAAVLALDLISDFSFPDGPRVRRALATRVPALQALMARARDNRVPVIYVNDNLGAWRSDAPALIARCTESRRAGAALVRSLSPDCHDDIVLKPRHSAFYGTPLAALLADRRIDTLIFSGVSIESCVWMTACDAHTRGYSLVIPADTVAGASAVAMRRTLASLRDVLGARVPARATSLRLTQGRLRG